jgi:acylphosphatase
MNIRVKVRIKGLVQGVSFRYYTQQKGLQLQVTGWVRNLPDGSVEGCFEGDDHAVHELVSWCRQGPGPARVDEVSMQQEPYGGEFSSFTIR